MDKFVFNLQNVLDYKVKVEDKRKEEFVIALKEFMYHESLLKELQSEREVSFSYMFKAKTILELQNFSRYVESLEEKIKTQMKVLNKYEKNLNLKKEELLKSTSDRKLLETLKGKAKEQFDSEMSRKEQRLNDDFAIFTYIKDERR